MVFGVVSENSLLFKRYQEAWQLRLNEFRKGVISIEEYLKQTADVRSDYHFKINMVRELKYCQWCDTIMGNCSCATVKTENKLEYAKV